MKKYVSMTTLCKVIILILLTLALTKWSNHTPYDCGDCVMRRENKQITQKFQSPQGIQAELHTDDTVGSTTAHPQAYLTIGIPTIVRENATYLVDTISSLFDGMTPTDTQNVVIVVFLADLDPGLKRKQEGEITQRFKEKIDSGLLHIIQAPIDYYPDFDQITKFTFKETEQHVKWRAKQVYDYSFLMEYSTPLSTYYLQIEDDVTVVSGFIQKIKRFMNHQKRPWVCLEFSELGFIGKFYRNSDLKRLVALMKLFYIEQPVDNLYVYFNMLNTQMTQRLSMPTLFQHRGIQSSLKGKIQTNQDRYFKNYNRYHNPAAKLSSSCSTFMTYYPKLAYTNDSDGYFWSSGPFSGGCHILVVFEQPQSLERVVIKSGNEAHPNDKIRFGSVTAGLSVSEKTCSSTSVLGKFENGSVDIKGIVTKVRGKIACLRIDISGKQKNWLIVQDIAVIVAELDSHSTTKRQ